MVTRKSEWLASITPIIDRESARKDAVALAKELSGILELKVGATPEDFSELSKLFNQQLQAMGKQPIVFSEQTLKGIVSQFANAIAQGVVAGINNGVQGGSGAALQQLQSELGNLKKERAQIQSDLDRRVTNKSKFDRANDFDGESARPLDVDGDVIQKAKDMYNDLVNHAKQLNAVEKEHGKDSDAYVQSLYRAREAMQDLYRMRQALKGTENVPESLRAAYGLMDPYTEQPQYEDRMESAGKKPKLPFYETNAGEFIGDRWERFAHAIDNSQLKLVAVDKKISEISAKIAEITSMAQSVGASDNIIGGAESGLKTLNEIEAAYRRLKLSEGTALKDQNLLHLNSALNYEPKETDGIKTFAQNYQNAAASGNWVEEYHALLRYVKLYESYLSSANKAHQNKVTKENNPYTQLYEQLKPMEANVRNMLQNIVNMGEGKPLVGMGGAEAEKAAVATQAVAASEASARAEADAKAKADQASAIAEEKARVEAEAKARADAEQAAAAERERAAQDATTAARKEELGLMQAMEKFQGAFRKTNGKNETLAFVNTKTGDMSDMVVGDAHGVTTEAGTSRKMSQLGYDMEVHSHSWKTAAPSVEDFEGWLSQLEYIKQFGIRAGKELLAFDFSKLDPTELQKIIQKYRELDANINAQVGSMSLDEKLNKFGSYQGIQEGIQVMLRQGLEGILQNTQGVMRSIEMPELPVSSIYSSPDQKNSEAKVGSIADAFKNANAEVRELIKNYAMLAQKGSLISDDEYDRFIEMGDQLEKVAPDVLQAPESELKSFAEKLTSDAGLIESEANAHEQNAASIKEETTAQEQLNQTEGQNPVAQNDSGTHNANAGAINAEANAQEQLNAAEGQNLLAKDEAGIHNANAGAINAEAQAQEHLNAAEGQNPVAQSDSGIHNENASAIQNETQALKEKLALLHQIASAYAAQDLAQDAYDNADTPKQEEGAERKLEAAKEAVGDFERQYHSAMVTMQDGTKINIPLDDEFAESSQRILTDASKIQNVDLVPRSAEAAIQAYERIEAIQGTVMSSLNRTWNMGSDRALSYLDRERADYEKLISNIDQADPNRQYGSQDTYNQAVQMLERINSLSRNINIRDAFTEQLNTLGLEFDTMINGPYETVLKGVRDGTYTTVDQCIAKFKELAGIKDTVMAGTGADTGSVVSDVDTGATPSGITTDGGADVSAEAGQIASLQKNIEAVTAAVATKTQAFTSEATEVQRVVSAEQTALEALRTTIEAVTTAVGAKTSAFTKDEAEVQRVVASEIASLDTLEQKVLSIRGTLEGLLANLKTGQSDIGAGLGNITVTVNKTGEDAEQKGSWALDTTVQSVRTSVDGIRTDLGNVITAIGNVNTQPSDVNSGAMLATESTLGAVKAVLDAINGKIVAGTKNGTENQSEGEKNTSSKKQEGTSQKKSENANDGKKDTGNQDDVAKLKELNAEYEKLGQLQARAEAADGANVKQEYENQIRLLQETIRVKQQGISVDEQAFDASRVAAYNKEINKLNLKRAKEQDRTDKKTYEDRVKSSRQEAGMTQAQSAIKKAGTTLQNAALIENAAPDAIAQFKQLDVAVQQLSATYNELNGKKVIEEEDQQRLIAQRENVNQLQSSVAQLVEEHQRLNGVNSQQIGTTSLGLGASSESQQKAITDAVMAATKGRAAIKGFNADTNELTYTLKTGANQLTTFKAAIDRTNGSIMTVRGNTTQMAGVFATLGKKIKEYSYYFTGSMMIYRAIAWVREGITAIKDIDTALTELKKVTDATEESYEKFLDTAAKTADKVGSTIKDVVSSTADWARLGYSMREAAELATSTQILMNVSEFDDVSKATDSLISAIQAFKYTAEESMDVVDILNTIGNNYAISTSDLAESLTKSSGSLVAANGTLEEAVALTAAANTIIQDADVVGTALKTVAMRLRGTSVTEMEEEGLDTEGAIESKSKLQSKIQGLSGVNILTDSGAYKSTYQILSEIANVWEDISDMDQAALLELLAGKRAGSTMAAILENPDVLKDAFESANDASGSALKENEKYLDSIQGKMDLFTNAVQTMWENAIGSEFVKFIVEVGTWLIKIVDNIGLINSVLIITSLIIMKINHMSLIDFFGSISTSIMNAANWFVNLGKSAWAGAKSVIGANTAMAQSSELTTAGSLRSAMATAKVSEENREAILSQLGLSGANRTQAVSRDLLTESTIRAMVAEGTLTESQAATIMSLLGIKAASDEVTAARMNEMLISAGLSKEQRRQIITQLGLSGSLKKLTYDEVVNAAVTAGMSKADAEAIAAKLGLTAANKGLAASFGLLLKSMAPMLILAAIGLAIWGIVKAFDSLIVTTDELKEELDDLKSEISEIESEIESINSELETTQERMAELLAMPSLSFVEEEELAKLQAQTAELERQLEIQEMLLKSKEAEHISAAEEWIDHAWNGTGLDQEYAFSANGTIIRDKWYAPGVSGKTALKQSLPQYAEYAQKFKEIEDLYMLSVQEIDKYGEMRKDTFVKLSDALTDAGESIGDNNMSVDEAIEAVRENLDYMKEGINLVLGDMSETISNNDLSYGMSDDIDQFLDEYYAYYYKYQEAQGYDIKSPAIKAIFDNSSSGDIEKLKENLTAIADDDTLDAAKKQEKALGLVNEAINSASGEYDRLKTSMDIIGITADEVARYFVQLSEQPDSSTVEGISAQYQKGIDALNKYKDDATGIIAKFEEINGTITEITWDDLFKDGKVVEANISKVLHGADETTRKEFSRIVQAVNDGKMSVDNALKSFSISGVQAGYNLLESSIIDINNDIFKDLDDEISGIIDTFKEFSSALESVADSIEMVNQAEAEMVYSGHVSVETALDLIESTEDWNKVLKVENGNITLVDGAMDILAQSKLNQIKTNLQLALSEAQAGLEQARLAQSSGEVAKTIEESTTESVRQLAANMEYLSTLIGEFLSGNFLGAGAAAKTAKENSLASTAYQKPSTTSSMSVADWEEKVSNIEAKLGILEGVDTPSEFQSNYPSDEVSGGNDTGKESKNALFQEEMDHWENRIAANQAKYEQIQNEIDLMEAKGQKAGVEYYERQIQLENERKWLLDQQLYAAKTHLATLEEGSEEWFRQKPACWETNKRIPLNCWNFLRALYTTTQG